MQNSDTIANKKAKTRILQSLNCSTNQNEAAPFQRYRSLSHGWTGALKWTNRTEIWPELHRLLDQTCAAVTRISEHHNCSARYSLPIAVRYLSSASRASTIIRDVRART